MDLPESAQIEVTPEIDDLLEAVPNVPAVFLISAGAGEPYLGRTTLLRRRLKRLLRASQGPSRLLNLRGIAQRIEYWTTASSLESSVLFYELARRHRPDDYLKLLRLRMPPYVRVTLSNRFPRTHITTKLASSRAFHYGPFRTRASAELFESQFLDLFQIRRCQDDLVPTPEHPGCIYGEMGMCLRPCQQLVSDEEYASEVGRVVEFLSTGGQTTLETITHARDRLSAECQFEDAAREHKRLERVQQILRLRDDLVCDTEKLCGVAVLPCAESNCVALWFVMRGCLLPPHRFGFEMVDGRPVSLDSRLRELAAAVEQPKLSAQRRQEHIALLARWFYSSWRDGEWIGFEDIKSIPYRKLVNAIHRVATGATRLGNVPTAS